MSAHHRWRRASQSRTRDRSAWQRPDFSVAETEGPIGFPRDPGKQSTRPAARQASTTHGRGSSTGGAQLGTGPPGRAQHRLCCSTGRGLLTPEATPPDARTAAHVHTSRKTGRETTVKIERADKTEKLGENRSREDSGPGGTEPG